MRTSGRFIGKEYSFWHQVYAMACSIASVGIAVSNALSTIPDSTTGEISENSLSCIQSQYTWVIILSLSGFWLNRTVLLVHGFYRSRT
jgi:uncharacterized membrane protein